MQPQSPASRAFSLATGVGEPLDEDTRSHFGSRLGRDFGDVRVHRDGDSARALGALAYTSGTDVVLGADAPDPATSAGWQLIGHELAHVAQHDGAPGTAIAPSDHPLEASAAQAGLTAAAGGQAPVARSAGPPLVHRQPQPKTGARIQPLWEEEGDELYVDEDYGGLLHEPGRMDGTESAKLWPPRPPEIPHVRLEFERHLHVTTMSGVSVDLFERAFVDLPDEPDSLWEALRWKGDGVHASATYTLRGHVEQGAPVELDENASTYGESLESVAGRMAGFAHFDIKPVPLYNAVIDALRGTVPGPPRPAPAPLPQARPVPKPPPRKKTDPEEEAFERMSRDEKADLASKRFWEEFSFGNVALAVLIGAAAILAAIAALVLIAEGAVALAIAAAAVAIGLAIYGLYSLFGSAIKDFLQRWAESRFGEAIASLARYLALAAAIVIGAVLLVGGLIAGGLSAGALAIGALVVLAVAATVITIWLVFRDLDHAADAPTKGEFERYVQRAARGAEEAISNVILLVLGWVLGKTAPRRGGGRPAGDPDPVPPRDPDPDPAAARRRPPVDPSPGLPAPGTILARGPNLAAVRSAYIAAARASAPYEIEVGMYRNPAGTEYIVVQGRRGSVAAPAGDWETVAHFHPGAHAQPGYRNPAVQDFHGMLEQSFRTGARVSETIHSFDADGNVVEVEFGFDPDLHGYFVRSPGEPAHVFDSMYPDDIQSRVNQASAIADETARVQALLNRFRGLDPNRYYAGWWARQFTGP